MIFAGQEYGTGSSRDWAAKGTRLLGVNAVVAQSFERIHRSATSSAWACCPASSRKATSAQTLGLDGTETLRPPRPREPAHAAQGRDPGHPPRERRDAKTSR